MTLAWFLGVPGGTLGESEVIAVEWNSSNEPDWIDVCNGETSDVQIEGLRQSGNVPGDDLQINATSPGSLATHQRAAQSATGRKRRDLHWWWGRQPNERQPIQRCGKRRDKGKDRRVRENILIPFKGKKKHKKNLPLTKNRPFEKFSQTQLLTIAPNRFASNNIGKKHNYITSKRKALLRWYIST